MVAPATPIDPQVVALVEAITDHIADSNDLLRAIELGLVHEIAVHSQKTERASDDGDCETTSSTSISFVLRIPSQQSHKEIAP